MRFQYGFGPIVTGSAVQNDWFLSFTWHTTVFNPSIWDFFANRTNSESKVEFFVSHWLAIGKIYVGSHKIKPNLTVFELLNYNMFLFILESD